MGWSLMNKKVVKGGQVKVLRNDQIADIHDASVSVLERTGVVVKEEEALKILDEAGAFVDFKKQHVRIPRYLVKEAINKCPSGFTLYGRNPKHLVRLEDNKVHFGMAGVPPNVIDLDGKRRGATWEDVKNFFILSEGLENIHVADFAVWPPCSSDVEWPVKRLLIAMENTEGPVTVGAKGTRAFVEDYLRLQAIVRGSLDELVAKPFWWSHVNPVSPLTYDERQTRSFLVYAKLGLPIHFGSEVQAGATGPVTLAGTLVQQNAENLGGIVIAQLGAETASPKRRPPIIYGTISTIMDMRTASPVLGGPETALLNIASAQMADYYGLPSRGVGEGADSKIPDIQAGYETSFALLASALAGNNYIYAAGGIEPGIMAISYEKAVLDNDLIGMIIRLLEGINICDDTLALDIIDEVGPGGNYLALNHTKDHFRKEHYYPVLFDKNPYEAWVKKGSKDIREAARERAKKILREYHAEPLDKDIKRELEAMSKEILKKHGEKKP